MTDAFAVLMILGGAIALAWSILHEKDDDDDYRDDIDIDF